jgi:AraC family transcriptional regulator
LTAITPFVVHVFHLAHSGELAERAETVYYNLMTSIDLQINPADYATSRVFYPAGDYRHPPVGLLQLRVVRRGSSYARIDLGRGLRNVFTRPGDLLLSLPNTKTRFQIDDSRDLTLLQVKLELVETVLATSSSGLGELVPLTERPFRDPLIAEICRRMENGDFVESPIGKHALSLVIGLLAANAKKVVLQARRQVLSERRLGDVIRRIDSTLEDTITVGQLARVAGMPVRKFSMAFRDALGMPVYQYVLRRRTNLARELLTSSNLDLSEIAQRAGFSHQAHMSRVVKRLLGTTPAQIRNSGSVK